MKKHTLPELEPLSFDEVIITLYYLTKSRSIKYYRKNIPILSGKLRFLADELDKLKK